MFLNKAIGVRDRTECRLLLFSVEKGDYDEFITGLFVEHCVMKGAPSYRIAGS
jgi:hypothetical protein